MSTKEDIITGIDLGGSGPGRSGTGGSSQRSLSLSVITAVYNERSVVEASLRKVLALDHPIITAIQLVVVDDHSTDGSWEILRRLAGEDSRILLLRHDRNRGKGSAIRTAMKHVTGDVTISHDADLEYDPADIPSLLVPFVQEGADAVFGTRFMASSYRRALMHRHTLVNRTLTELCNWFTDLSLTDLQTCYKAVRTPLLKSIPLRSDDFRIEVELVFKLAKRRARIFEAPIRYMPRTYEEGKKISVRDSMLSLQAMLHFFAIDDVYQHDEYGSHILVAMERARRFNLWMADVLRPYIGNRVLEIGAGIGTLTNQFIPRDFYLASDINPHFLGYLQAYAIGKPYLEVAKIDAGIASDFEGLEGRFDTALAVNVIEHLDDSHATMLSLHRSLAVGGRCVLIVPQYAWLYGAIDEVADHKLRYSKGGLRKTIEDAGFVLEVLRDFNRFSLPAWWVNGKVLKRKRFSRVQLKALDSAMPLLKRLDSRIPWGGQSLLAVGRKV